MPSDLASFCKDITMHLCNEVVGSIQVVDDFQFKKCSYAIWFLYHFFPFFGIQVSITSDQARCMKP